MNNEIISAFEVRKSKSNEETIVKNFWEKMGTASTKPSRSSDAVLPYLAEQLKQASEFVLIYSPLISSKELDLAFRDLHKKGIRIYILCSRNYFEKLRASPPPEPIIRATDNIETSFVLIDPKNNNSKGFWTPESLSPKTDYFLELGKKQIKAFYDFFIEKFWSKHRNQEIFLGKTSQIPKQNESPYDSTTIDYSSWIHPSPTEWLDDADADHIPLLWIRRKDFELFEDRLIIPEAETIILEESHLLKQFLENHVLGLNENTKKLQIATLPTSLVTLDSEAWLISNDYAFRLLKQQEKNVKRWISPQWEFHYSKPIREISGKICTWESDWSSLEKNAIIVQDYEEVRLRTVSIPSLEEFAQEYQRFLKGEQVKQPDIPQEVLYCRNINFTWTIEPPYLPEGSKPHDLYERWPSLIKQEIERLSKTKRILARFMEFHEEQHSKKSKSVEKIYKKNKKSFQEWIKRLDVTQRFLTQILDKIKHNELDKVITEETKKTIINEINQYNELVDMHIGWLRELRDTIVKNKQAFVIDLDEIAEQDPEKRRFSEKMEKFLKDTEREKLNERDLKIDEEKIDLLQIPPSVGKLFKFKARYYLVVERYGEIPQAKIVARKYENAPLCVLRSIGGKKKNG